MNKKQNLIGTRDTCPYCNKKLDIIPSKKKPCSYCHNDIYVRTRPEDRKKILVTEKQREDIELRWQQHYQEKEEKELIQNPDFNSAKKELTKQFGKEPPINDIKWRVFNQNIIKYASKKRWGLYRNNKLEMAFLLQKENKLNQSLSTLFEVVYLDINGGNNVVISESKTPSQKEMKEYNIKEFDPKMAFMAPAVIGLIQHLIDELRLSSKQAKELFISTNTRMKPVKTMPISEEKAWNKLQEEIKIQKENEKKIEKFNAEDIDAVIIEIKEAAKNKDILSSIIYKFRDKYNTKKMITPNANKIKKVIEKLLNSSKEIKNLGVSLLLFFAKKDKDLFEPLVQNYIKQNKIHFEQFPEELTIGELGKIEPKWIQDLIPIMIKALTQNPEWNTRRFVAFNLGSIGSKHPKLVKEAIPIMVDYIKNPNEITKRKPTIIKTKDYKISLDLSPEKMLGVDQKQWLKDAYIDSLGMIAKGDKNLIESYKYLFEKIAKKDKSEYSRKKAQRVLKLL